MSRLNDRIDWLEAVNDQLHTALEAAAFALRECIVQDAHRGNYMLESHTFWKTLAKAEEAVHASEEEPHGF